MRAWTNGASLGKRDKRNRATVQRGYSLIQLLVVMLLVSILVLGRLKDT